MTDMPHDPAIERAARFLLSAPSGWVLRKLLDAASMVAREYLRQTPGTPEFDEMLDEMPTVPMTDDGVDRITRKTTDELIADLESRGLGWSLDHTGRLIEARVWEWPICIGRHRPEGVIPLQDMLAEAIKEVDLSKYPILEKQPCQ